MSSIIELMKAHGQGVNAMQIAKRRWMQDNQASNHLVRQASSRLAMTVH